MTDGALPPGGAPAPPGSASAPSAPLAPEERLRRLRELFDRLAPLPGDARGPLVAAAAAADALLGVELAALLAAHDAAVTGELLPSLAAHAGPAPGTQVGPYRVLERLGAGGMGVVVRAVRADAPSAAPEVALKLLRHGALAGPELVARFARERRALARLDHPAIARLVDAGVEGDGAPWLAMELVDGERIDRWCDRRGAPARERVRLMAEVCRAVAHAHARGVLHRDLKPSNVLVDARGRAKLVDFGVAKLATEGWAADRREAGGGIGDTEAPLTRLRAAPLTPEYAAPEQRLGGAATAASDVYALGVILHELLVGRRPGAPDGGAPGRDRVPGALGAVVGRALAEQPGARYASAAALADDLDRVLAGRRPAALWWARRARVHAALWPAGPAGRAARLGVLALTTASAVAALAALAMERRQPEPEGRPVRVEGAEAAAWWTTAPLVGVNGWVDCDGRTPPPHTPAGQVRARRTASGALELEATLAGAPAHGHYSLELFEQAPGCGSDNLARTGAVLRADATGRGALRVRVALPRPTLGGAVLGDEAGSETLVVVLDESASTGSGDRYLARLPLPPAPLPAAAERDRVLAEAARAASQYDTRRADSLLRRLVARAPGDARAWFELGEVTLHWGAVTGLPLAGAREPFARAAALRPGDADVILHLAMAALRVGDRGAGAVLLDSVMRLNPAEPVRQRALRFRALALGGPAALRAAIDATLQLPDDEAIRALNDALEFAALPGTVERLADALVRAGRGAALRRTGWLVRAEVAMAAGQRAAARRAAWEAAHQGATGVEGATIVAYFATLPIGAPDHGELRRVQAALGASPGADRDPDPDDPGPWVQRRYLAAQVALRLGDTALARAELARLATGASPAAAAAVADLRRALGGRLAAPAPEAPDGVPTPVPSDFRFGGGAPLPALWRTLERFRHAELLAASGRDAEALGWYEGLGGGPIGLTGYSGPALLGAARALERLGRREEAIARYRRLVALWRDCDPALRPLRAEAERALARLGVP